MTSSVWGGGESDSRSTIWRPPAGPSSSVNSPPMASMSARASEMPGWASICRRQGGAPGLPSSRQQVWLLSGSTRSVRLRMSFRANMALTNPMIIWLSIPGSRMAGGKSPGCSMAKVLPSCNARGDTVCPSWSRKSSRSIGTRRAAAASRLASRSTGSAVTGGDATALDSLTLISSHSIEVSAASARR